jgi:hypothetical protein
MSLGDRVFRIIQASVRVGSRLLPTRRTVLLRILPAMVAVSATAALGVLGVVSASRSSTTTTLAGSSLERLRALPPINAALYQHPDDVERIKAAQSQLTVQCMAKRGLVYRPEPVTDDAGIDVPMPFGVESLSDPDFSTPNLKPEATGEAAQRLARGLYGDPTKRVTARSQTLTVTSPATGCVAEAEQHLLGDSRVQFLALRLRLFEVESTALDRLQQDPVFAATQKQWRKCMSSAGAPAQDPRSLLEKLPAHAVLHSDPSVRKDLACKGQTDYLGHGYSRLAAVQRRLLASQPTLLPQWGDLEHRQVMVAERVLAK